MTNMAGRGRRTELADLVITSSARVDRGKVSNRIRRVRTPRPKGERPPRQRPEPRFKEDPAVRGKPYTIIAISMPVVDADALAAFADRVQMSKSHLVRTALEHFRASCVEFNGPRKAAR